MEEASVAGESPDRSKQRESSAEPTSGSASPVPEARNGATTARDPRLAVARESGGGRERDTATRVLSVKELSEESEESEGAAGEAASEQPTGREKRAGAGNADESDAAGDERLRAAVAAWVTSGEGRPEGGAAEGGDEVDTNADKAAAEPGNKADTNADKAAAEGGTDADTNAHEPGDKAAAKPGNEAQGEREGGTDAAGAEKPADAEDSGEEGAAEDATPAGEENSGEVEAPARQGERAEEPDARGEKPGDTGAPAADAQDGPEDDAQSGAAEKPTAQGASAADPVGQDRENARTADHAEPGDADAAAEETGGDADHVRGTATAAEDAQSGAAEKPTAQGASAADPVGQDRENARTADHATRTDRTTAESRSEGHRGPQSRTGDAPKADAPPVDQPTAVFRAVKPSTTGVDQPTTTLKLGGAKKPAPAPESDAERTSRFVALKPLDDPSTRKPQRAAEATTALPKVPSDKPKAPAEATTALPRIPADQTAPVPQVGPERTTQQPLPPKPPLDLLAELTNTPPPPETPLRTAVRRIKIWTPLVLLLAIVFAIVQAVRPLPTPTLELTAEDSYTFDGNQVTLPWPNEGQGAMDVTGIGTMGGFGEQKPVAIGSVAKAMTAYVVLQKHPLKPGEEGPKITVDALAEKEGGYDQVGGESTLNTVKEGDQLTLRQALSAIMIPSANNIARLLARWDAGTEAAFIKKMNDTAKELGMKNTTYTDASGLKETTVSTAEDQVKLGNELVKIPALVEITKLPEWFDPSGQKWRNWNTLVPYNGAIGIKTGTTTAAGGNLLFAATKEVGGETVTVVGAILGQHKAPIIDTVNAVSETAMLGAQDALTSAKILKKGDVVGYVDDRLGGRTPVVVTQDVTAVGWAGLKVKLSFASDAVPHTAKSGTKVGTLTVGDGSGGAVEVPVALQSDLTEPGFTDKLTRVA
ncbi:D-alanyl-D-alanine carboxypeptidase [Streptomyces sp. TRM70350]|uniref:D-alanyl-D-alanine carboxypeptidase n=1 Tax=Streptomyces sp. TRM70350 TaxID=2856165 RepID=UPI001C44A36A|nr:D-alanyl-D-alanine carboxypeptidase [Streptomyces sp. TRM70350]MBV7696614.1 D-alanyl-D-alanine carboxypeptidase [Streptomyces sp. TRM70350]